MSRIVKEICDLQDIKYKPGTKVKCPYCNNKAVEIDQDKWHCKCGKKGDIMELLRLAEEEYLSAKPRYFWGSRNNKGVGY